MGCRTLAKQHRPKWQRGNIENYSPNKCMLELGAPKEEVYFTEYEDGRYMRYVSTAARKSGYGKRKRSIYSRYTKEDLWFWGRNLYKKKIRECHPDKHKENKEHWEEYFKYICQVFDKLRRICRK